MTSITARGIRVWYEESGPVGGRSCVLIHGFTGSVAEWSTVIPMLNDLGWRTLAIDCPGHGRSASPPARDACTMHALADLHHDVAVTLGFRDAVVLGFSTGGAVAEEYALRHPNDVRALVLFGSAGRDMLSNLVDLELPTLIVHGDREEGSIVQAARRQHRALGSSYAVVPDAGHFAQDDNPGALNAIVRDFLATLE